MGRRLAAKQTRRMVSGLPPFDGFAFNEQNVFADDSNGRTTNEDLGLGGGCGSHLWGMGRWLPPLVVPLSSESFSIDPSNAPDEHRRIPIPNSERTHSRAKPSQTPRGPLALAVMACCLIALVETAFAQMIQLEFRAISDSHLENETKN